jgi:hypothetical protein
MTAAVVTGAASLLGVVIGGLLTGLVQTYRELRRERQLARAGARLLSTELTAAAETLNEIVNDARVAAERIPHPPDAWAEYRQALALHLPPADWRAASAAVASLNGLCRSLTPLIPHGGIATSLPATVTSATRSTQVLVSAAIKNLAVLADKR